MVSVNPNASDRAGHIGGSDASAIMGVSKRRTALGVWLRIMGQAGPDEDNEAMWWGRALEPIILKRYAEQNGVTLVDHNGSLSCEIQDEKRPWRVGHLDAELKEAPIVVDAKAIGIVGFEGKQWGTEGTDQVPADVLCQMHHYLSIHPYKAAHVPALIAGRGLQTFSVLPNAEFEAYLIEREEKFWRDHVENKVPPDMDSSDECSKWLARIHPVPTKPDLLDSTPALDEIAMAYKSARARRLLSEEEEDLYANRLRALIGDARGIKGPWGAVLWGTNGKGGRKLTPKFNEEEAGNV